MAAAVMMVGSLPIGSRLPHYFKAHGLAYLRQ
jgi:hypothetical protein